MRRIFLSGLRCHSLASGAVMRSPRLPCSWLFRRPNACRRAALAYSCRKLHRSFTNADSSNIFPDNLQKTLDAHRSSNRASIIRKVPAGASPKIIFHAVINKDDVSHRQPNGSQLLGRTSQLVGPADVLNAVALRSSRRPFRKRLSQSYPPHLQLNPWSVDEAKGRSEQCPWMDYVDLSTKSSGPMSRLDAEIRALERYMLPTPWELPKVDDLVADVTNELKGVAFYPPIVAGSRRTGFATSHSNLDLILRVDNEKRLDDKARGPMARRPRMRKIYLDLLQQVASGLERSPQFHQVQMLKRAPVVLAIHSPTDLQLQLSCGRGLPSSVEYISSYVAEYPDLRPLYIAARVILEAQSMLGAHRSSIRSSALLMLLVAFLKMNHGRFQHPAPLGEELLAFLRTYGTAVDLRTTGISVDPPGFFSADSLESETSDKKPLTAERRGQQSLINVKHTAARRRNFPTARRLCIQDPSNYMVDIGRSCTRTAELQKTFSDAHGRLQASLETWGTDGHTLTHNTERSILSHTLRANFSYFEAKRVRLSFGPD